VPVPDFLANSPRLLRVVWSKGSLAAGWNVSPETPTGRNVSLRRNEAGRPWNFQNGEEHMRRFILWAALLLLISIPAIAQNTPKAEVFGGYSGVPVVGVEQFLHGWNASVNGNINDWLGIKCDFSGHYTTGRGLKVKLYTFTFGPQLSYRKKEKVVPFFHALFGGGWASAGFGDINISNSAFVMNLGGGLDWVAHKNCAVRVIQLDLLVTRFGPDASFDPRISAGIVLRFGSK